MLYYNRNYLSKSTDIAKTNSSKECIICHYSRRMEKLENIHLTAAKLKNWKNFVCSVFCSQCIILVDRICYLVLTFYYYFIPIRFCIYLAIFVLSC